MASYEISENIASHALKELIRRSIVEKRGEVFYLPEELKSYK